MPEKHTLLLFKYCHKIKSQNHLKTYSHQIQKLVIVSNQTLLKKCTFHCIGIHIENNYYTVPNLLYINVTKFLHFNFLKFSISPDYQVIPCHFFDTLIFNLL